MKIMLALCLQSVFIACALAQNILLPGPRGPYDVFIRTSEIVDRSRNDGAYPKPHPDQPRRLMVSAFSPTGKADPSCRSKYMLDRVAKSIYKVYSGSLDRYVNFTRFVLPTCSEDVTYKAPSQDCGAAQTLDREAKLPIVLFSPALTTSRFAYNIICSSLASQGWLVLSIDSPFSSGLVQFPDGTVLKQKITNDSQLTHPFLLQSVQVRAKDVTSVINALTTNKTLTDAIFPCNRPDFDRIGMWGHSIGGASAAQATYEDTRIRGGINMDGRMLGSVINHGFSRPFILWQSIDGASRKTEPSWRSFWSHLTGFRRNFGVYHCQHFSYTDFETLSGMYPFKAPGLLAAIHGRLDIEIITAYSNDFFGWLLKGKKKKLIDGPSKRFPQVFFIP